MKRVIAFLLFFNILLPNSGSCALSTKTSAPDFQTVKKWLTPATPLSKQDLAGKIVLITFCSPSNAQSLWELNLFTKWYKTYSPSAPFTIVAFMVPEFFFETDEILMEASVRKLRLPFPVALDMSRSLSNLYNAPNIPTHFLMDHQGRIRGIYSGGINYKDLEKQFRALLPETPLQDQIPFIEKTKFLTYTGKPELYFGYKKLRGYGNPEKLQSNAARFYQYPVSVSPFQFYIQGNWKSKEESLEIASSPASIKIPFEGKRAGIVAGSVRKSAVPAEVRLDGLPIPKTLKGADIIYQEGRSYVLIREYRYYKLLNLKGKSGSYAVEVLFEEPGAEIFKASFS